jgi:hypothetical protein
MTRPSEPKTIRIPTQTMAELIAQDRAATTIYSCCQMARAAQPNGPGWLSLPFAGIQDDGGAGLELRHCRCGSTLALDLGTVIR